ncbi:MAG TPA: aldo/keto reductase [Terriglobales bacterium]|nr:aldo/keto reductase [Terriglobales bacterium]
MSVSATRPVPGELEANEFSSVNSNPALPEFVLGTAQLGLKYGRVNDRGKPTRQEALQIVRHAINRGVFTFDTARAYGDSEEVIGEAAAEGSCANPRIVTKLDLSGLSEVESASEVLRRVDESIESSCQALRADKLQTVLLHNWVHFRNWGGAAWERLVEHRNQGTIERLGASIYEPAEALDALQCPDIKHLQIPLNILDRRWSEVIRTASRDRCDVVVHARSVLLQGILAHGAERWPAVKGFESRDCILSLHALTAKFDRVSIADLCFAYVKSLPLNGMVVGCETLEQLDQNLCLFLRPGLTPKQTEEVEQAFPTAPVELLNPAKWQQSVQREARYAT